MDNAYPILEYDPTAEAIIEPKRLVKPLEGMPEHGVICFFHDVIEHFASEGRLTLLKNLRSEMGVHPIYAFSYAGQTVALFQPGVGAPLAAGLLEGVIALGCRKFVACGGAGVLDRDLAMGHLLVPIAAIRDEGTSYHYLPPAREVAADPAAVAAIETVLQQHRVDYLLTKTWTTDAFYRETRSKVTQRKGEGCLAVEMEAAALFAVAQFRGVPLGYILYSGDNLAGEAWESREKLVGLATEACLLL
ncbi:MAG: nucleoside phosphorylase [Chloroflexi bacterium]|nr:nucleoside phosphorylase [Chloroflexota bacterium]